jgi:peroxiredoxin Q/BCP
MLRPLCAAVLAGLCLSAAAADDTKLKVKAGDRFPDIPLPAVQAGKVKPGADALSVADLKGKVVVVFFYPKALTRGCTVESCGFRDLAGEFPKDAVVLGASADDKALQQKFIDAHNLPFPLLCDTDRKLIRELGILSANGRTPQRVTFVVGKDGTIAKVYDKVDPAKHPKEVLELVKGLQK